MEHNNRVSYHKEYRIVDLSGTRNWRDICFFDRSRKDQPFVN